METLYTYVVLIHLPGEIDPYPLLVTTDSNKAFTAADKIKDNWKELGEERDIWVLTHELKDNIEFDYDWLNEDSDCDEFEEEFEIPE